MGGHQRGTVAAVATALTPVKNPAAGLATLHCINTRASTGRASPEYPMPTATVPTTTAADTAEDGFDALDACHRDTLVSLRQLEALAAALDGSPLAPAERAVAAGLISFFGEVSRQHHEDEERHVFPKLLAGPDAELAGHVRRLQEDHHWLDADWNELAPQLDALAHGYAGVDIDVLREGVAVFAALSQEHVELEESCIYPQARKQAVKSERRAMAREMAARRAAARPPRR
jgi:hemerythrin-like domain-containing protein